jgi:hypothetical protein
MGPLGHLGITLGAAHISNRAPRLELKLWVVAFAALLPDLVDKPLYLLGIGEGRYVGHTLLFVCVVAAVVSLKNKMYGLSLLFGAVLHLLFDWGGFVPWLYPFISYDFIIDFDPAGIYDRLLTLFDIAEGVYYSPLSLATELIGLLVILGLSCHHFWRYIRAKRSNE